LMLIKLNELDAKKLMDREELLKLHYQGIDEIENLSPRDMISLWGFFKMLMSDTKSKEGNVYITNGDSIIYEHREAIEKNTNIKIQTPKDFLNQKS